MTCPRLAVWLLRRMPPSVAGEALIGDLLEEIAHGRSHAWVWQQLLGLCGGALVAQVHTRVVTVPMIAVGLGGMLVGGSAIAPLGQVFQTWLYVYFLAGLLGLFGHLLDSRELRIPARPK